MTDKKSRGLDELAYMVALDLEPIDPPDGLEDRILSKIEKAETSSVSSVVSNPINDPKKIRIKWWARVASVACAALMVLYGVSLYENHRLKESIAEHNLKHGLAVETNKLGELGENLGSVEKIMPMRGKHGASGKAYFLKGSDIRLVILGEGITKGEDEILQVWVKDGDNIRPLGATEPSRDRFTFASTVTDVNDILITLERTYQKAPTGEVLLASTDVQPPGGTENNPLSEKVDYADTDKNDTASTTPLPDKEKPVPPGNDKKPSNRKDDDSGGKGKDDDSEKPGDNSGDKPRENPPPKDDGNHDVEKSDFALVDVKLESIRGTLSITVLGDGKLIDIERRPK